MSIFNVKLLHFTCSLLELEYLEDVVFEMVGCLLVKWLLFPVFMKLILSLVRYLRKGYKLVIAGNLRFGASLRCDF